MHKRLIDDVIIIAIGENSTQTKIIIKALENSLGNIEIEITTKPFNIKFTDDKVDILNVLDKHFSESSFNFVTWNLGNKL